jgi:hypothetical protein
MVERQLEIINESKDIINKSKNIETIFSRFDTIFRCINKIREYDTTYPGLKLKPTVPEIEQFYLDEKEKFLPDQVIKRVNEIINEINTKSTVSQKRGLGEKGLTLIERTKKEVRDNANITNLETLANKLRELCDISEQQIENIPLSGQIHDGGSYTIRSGDVVKTDHAFDAWTSNDLPKMLKTLSERTNPVDRHFLLMGIVEETYKRREDPEMRKKCKEISELHLKEFPDIKPSLWREVGEVSVPTFEKYATVLTEDGEFEKAIEVCNSAIGFKLKDGTKSGYEGRIERIKKRIEKGARIQKAKDSS